jgi:hypothetical protein
MHTAPAEVDLHGKVYVKRRIDQSYSEASLASTTSLLSVSENKKTYDVGFVVVRYMLHVTCTRGVT